MDDWRFFLYPLGFLSSIAFGGRFIIQWIQSEQEGQSIVSRSFWYLSLIGNILLTLHSVIQGQFHVGIAQSCNCVISWRNLDLMQTERPPLAFKKVLFLLAGSIAAVTFCFALQDFFFHEGLWFRIPSSPWQNTQDHFVSLQWHLFGFVGYILFSSRFWIQWWITEQVHQSCLPLSFWWLSLIGSLISIFYFFHIFDLVNLIGPVVGLVPYVRNLMLIYKSKRTLQNT